MLINSKLLAPVRFSFVFVIIIAAAYCSFLGGGLERVAIVFFISLTAVVGIGLYSGNSGILSFGHVAFMAIAAYLSGILTMPLQMKSVALPNLPEMLATAHLGFAASASISVLVVMVFALIVGLILARLEGAAAIVGTLGLLIIAHGIITGASNFTRGAQTFFGVPRETGIWVAALVCAAALVVARCYRDSVFGLKLRASREDRIAADVNGVSVRRERLIAWVLSSGVVGLAGVLLGHYLGAFSPKNFYFSETFFLLAMLIVGGKTTVTGAIAGAVAITLIAEVLRRIEGNIEILGVQLPPIFGATQIGIGLAILFVMFRRPEGISGFDEWDERLFGRLATPKTEKDAPVDLVAGSREELCARNMVKEYGGIKALSNVSVTLRPGEIVGVVGPNGSGKSTLLNALSGVVRIDSGEIRRGSVLVNRHPIHKVACEGVARTFQNIRLFRNLTVRQNVLVAALLRWPKVTVADAQGLARACLERMMIADKAERKAETLSYGDQRRLEIARALALQPSLLLLDEPAAGMNPEETEVLKGILQELRAQNLGILIVDHDMPLITTLCDRLLVLNSGRLIFEGIPADAQSDPAVIAAYLGSGKRSNDIVQ